MLSAADGSTEGVAGDVAMITVYREYGSPLARRLTVLLDGQRVGRLASEARLTLAVPAGTYSVQVALDWLRSAPVSVVVGLDDVATLRARMDLRAVSWVGLVARPAQALDLDLV